MRNKGRRRVTIPKSLLPSPKKIAKKNLYCLMWGKELPDYGKRLEKGRY